MANKTGSAYDAFTSVDEAVAKAVVGSDGAASWQQFRKEAKLTDHISMAPNLQVKRSDRLGTGFTSLEQERAHEATLREQAGQDKVGVGYKLFKQKHDKEQAASEKERKRIRQRIRPEEQEYFIPSKQFNGFRFDYVFTTKSGATGYYWDGMDSLKRLATAASATSPPRSEKTTTKQMANATPNFRKIDSSKTTNVDDPMQQLNQPKKKKRKKDNVSKQTPDFVHDAKSPLEIVANAINNRNKALAMPPGGLPRGWEKASDPTGKTYYFHRATNKRQWQRPTEGQMTSTWKVAQDSSGKQYYYNDKGETSWQKPP